MTTYVEPQAAQIGDLVFSGSFKGVVCGTSNDDAHAGGGTVSVVWSFALGCDVIGIKSPFWMHYDIVRYGAPVPTLTLPWSNPDGA